jgi:predicted dehydrogenase
MLSMSNSLQTSPRVAIIGCGLVGEKRVKLLAPGQVTVTCDLNLDRARKLAALSPGCVATDSVEQALVPRMSIA